MYEVKECNVRMTTIAGLEVYFVYSDDVKTGYGWDLGDRYNVTIAQKDFARWRHIVLWGLRQKAEQQRKNKRQTKKILRLAKKEIYNVA